MSKYQAIQYVRLSYSDDKSKESDSIANQKKMIEDFVAQNPDIELVDEKIDDGYSGVIFDRPAFKEMMELIEAGKINCVIVKDLSRLGREYIETGRYLRRTFPAFGVRFIAINDNIDTLKDSADDLMISLKNIINDAYSRDISVKTRSALEAKRRNGDYVGAIAVYGYRKSEENKNHLVIDEYAARVVRDIFRMKIDGASAARIASELNRLGILSPVAYKKNNGVKFPSGGYADKEDAKWSATTIIRILKDETYEGTLVQGRRTTHNHKIKDEITKPSDEWERIESAHEAIILKRDFDLVQRIINLDTRTSPDESKVYLFSGVLICGCCGGRMKRKTVPAGNKKYFYYWCPTGKKNGCNAPMIKEIDLIDCVLQGAQAFIKNVASLEKILKSDSESKVKQELIKKHTAQIQENEAQLETIMRFKATLYERFVSNFIDKDEYKFMKSQYDENGAKLKDAIASLKQELEDALNNSSERLRWIEHFMRHSNLEEVNRRVVVQLIKSITVVGKSKLDISFNYEDEYKKAAAFVPKLKEAV